MLHERPHSHSGEHAFSFLNGRAREGLTVFSRRSMLKASLAGLAGLTIPGLLQVRGEAVKNGKPIRGNKRVILLWMAGGPSQARKSTRLNSSHLVISYAVFCLEKKKR